MKKILPIFLVVLAGLLVVGSLFWFFNRGKGATAVEEETTDDVLVELAPSERPYVALAPGQSCEYNLFIDNIKLGIATLEYEVTYTPESGVLQGAPGSIDEPASSEKRDLLFGTESSGHRRCDKGVEEGKVTIRYRNEAGKLISKVESEFHIQENAKKLTSLDGMFFLTLSRPGSGKYITMGTIGYPSRPPGEVVSGPYGVFTDAGVKSGGSVNLSGSGALYGWNGLTWVEISEDETSFLGTFLRTSN